MCSKESLASELNKRRIVAQLILYIQRGLLQCGRGAINQVEGQAVCEKIPAFYLLSDGRFPALYRCQIFLVNIHTLYLGRSYPFVETCKVD